ncbi:MAG: hypothetical protein LBU07_07655 [Coriobacteriales bacterium]|nr:hypothetical protein [Coriobacteriales bacterium]
MRLSGLSRAVKRWTPEQVSLITHIPVLLRSGLSLEEVAQLAAQGTQAVHERLRAQYTQEARESRRALKSLTLRAREVSDTLCLRDKTDSYLRYIPQRWMALLPVTDTNQMPGQPGHVRLYADLLQTAGAVGWSLTESSGTLTSLSLDGASTSVYSYVGLSSPPMPFLTMPVTIDGGCYHSVNSSFDGRECDGEGCAECALFGHIPTKSEQFNWSTRQRTNPDISSHTIMASAMPEPYAQGIWSHNAHGCLRAGTAAFITVKPRLMPHTVKLPLGVTACAMPAGVYLCYPCDEGRQEAAYERMMGLASAIPQQKFSTQDELAALEAACGVIGSNCLPDSGPVPDPFTAVPMVGDPAMAGWIQEVTRNDVQRLIVPTNTALEPEDGYCVICAALPFMNCDDPMRYEVQLLVTPPLRKMGRQNKAVGGHAYPNFSQGTAVQSASS